MTEDSLPQPSSFEGPPIELSAPAFASEISTAQMDSTPIAVPMESLPVLMTPTAELAPVQAKERYEILDILRGLALFGIIMANMRGFNSAEDIYFDPNFYFKEPLDVWVSTLTFALFQGKFISLFSFMFGLGFAVQFTRGMEKGRAHGGWVADHLRLSIWLVFLGIIGLPLFSQIHYLDQFPKTLANRELLDIAARIATSIAIPTLFWALYQLGLRKTEPNERQFLGYFVRRMGLLYLLGWMHVSLIWFGDVLTQYAGTGYLLLLFRKASPKKLMRAAVIIALLPIVIGCGQYIYLIVAHKPMGSALPTAVENAKRLAEIATNHRLFNTAGYLFLIAERVKTVWGFMPWMVLGVGVGFLPQFLMGLWVWRKGILKDMQAHLPMIRRAWVFLGILSVLFWTFGWIIPALVDIPKGQTDPNFLRFMRSISTQFHQPFMAMFYACSFALALQNERVYNFFRPCAAIGKTCLSNYLLQSLVGMLLFTSVGIPFYGHGIQLFGNIQPRWNPLISLTIYLLQIPLSQWYLRHYKMGPVEWAWRSLAYGKMQAIRRQPDEVSVAQPAMA